MGKVKLAAPDGMVMASTPSFVSVSPLPVRPLTLPPTVKELVVQLTVTLLTAAPAMVPVALATLQLWLGELGGALTATEKVAPLATAAGKVNPVLALTVSGAPPFKVSDTVSPGAEVP